MSSLSFFAVALLLLLSLSFTSAVITNRQSNTIQNAGGVALSADGTLAFIHTTSTTSASVYAVTLPVNASGSAPNPYFVNANSVQYYYIAASVSTSPQIIWLMDNQNAQLVSLVYTPITPATSTSLVYNFASANATNVDLVDGMYYQASTNLLYFSLYDHYNGATFDYIAVMNPSAASPSLTTFFTTTFQASLSALAVSSSYLYFGVSTSVVATSTTVAQIYRVPLSSVGSANPTVLAGATASLIYQTTDSNLANVSATGGNLIYPAGFALNRQENILYMSDIGNQNAQPASTPHAIYALWPLYLTQTATFPQLNLTTVFAQTGANIEIQQNIALSPDGGTVYYAATGNKNGLYTLTGANTTIVPALNNYTYLIPPTTAGGATSAPIAATSAVIPPTSAVIAPTSAVVSPTSPVVRPTSTVVAPTSAAAGATSASGTITRPAGFITAGAGFSFSDANDALSCLSSDSLGLIGFSASDGGDIFTWSLVSTPATINPAYIAGTGSTGASFIACQANPAGTFLYLLDTRGILLYRWNVLTPTVAPVIISTFSDESTGTLTALAIDFTNNFAYVGTRNTDFIYSVDITTTGQNSQSFFAQPANSDITSFFLSPDLTTLYYGFPAPAQGVAGGIASLELQANTGTIPYSGNPTTVVQSIAVIYPDSIYVNGTGLGQTLYFKDGGPLHGEAGPNANSIQTINAVNLNLATPTITVLYSTTTINLPPGLIETVSTSVARVTTTGVTSLIFTTATNIEFITLVNSSVPILPPTTVTSAPATSTPATSPLITSAPATSPRPTSAPATSPLITSAPATSPLITSAPATSPLITSAPATSPLITSAPATSPLITSAPATSARPTSAPATSAPATSPLVTSAPATSPLITSAPATSPLITSAPATSPLVTSAPATSPLVTSAPATSPLVTSAPVTSALAPTSRLVTSPVAPTSALVPTLAPTSAAAPTGTGRIIGDPMFVGFLRQRYQVHGMDGVVYNILSQASVSINALFVFLESGECPVVDGVKATNCWSHPGSYFGSLSMQTAAGDQLEIVAGTASTGFSAIRFDGETVKAVKGVEGKGAKLSFQMLSTHSMAITIDNYRLVIENSDLFVNLVSIEVLDWQQLASVDQPHGLLGQTWKPTRKGRGGQVVAVKDVAEGDVDDYVIASDSIFGTDFLYNKFAKEQ